MVSLGERLRREREKQGMTLDEVFSSTRINPRMLRAIEEEKFELLPGGIFNKGFVRAYARHLNLDEQQAVDDYLTLAGLAAAPTPAVIAVEEPTAPTKPAAVEQVEVKTVTAPQPEPRRHKRARHRHLAQAAKAKAAEPQKTKEVEVVVAPPAREKVRPEKTAATVSGPRRSPGERIPWGTLAFALLLIAFGVAIWGSFAREPEPAHSSRPVAVPASKPAPPAAQAATPAATVPEAAAPAQPAQVAPAVADQSALPAQDASPVAETVSAATPVQPSGSFMVVVQAHQDSWVSITADGKEVVKQVLGASAAKTVEARKEIVVKVGNAGGVDFLFNGKKLPAQGEQDEVKRLVFDPNGLETPVSKAPTTLASRPAA